METVFVYCLLGILAFCVLSGTVMKIYISLISDAMSAKYPDEYQRVFWSDRYWTILRPLRILRTVKSLGDDKLKNMASIGLFWFNCMIGGCMAFPVGMVIFVIYEVFAYSNK